MSCAQCGAVVAQGSNFCSNCGARAAAVPPSESRQAGEQLTWTLRHEAGLPLKAYFYWKKKDGRLVGSAEFTQSELEVEVERRIEHGEDPTQFVLALKKLARSRGPHDRGEPSVTPLEVSVVVIAMVIALGLGALILAFPPKW
jgi:hypothetical protein